MKSRARGISLSYVYTLLNIVSGIFLSAFIIRMLGKTEYGVYQTMTSFLTYLVLFEFGTGTIMTRNLALCNKNPHDKDVISNYSTIILITIILSCLIIVTAIIFYCNLDWIYAKTLTKEQIHYGQSLFLIMAVRTVFTFLIQSLDGALLGFEQYSFGQITKIVYILLRTFLVVALLLLVPSALTIVMIDTILTIVQLLITIWFCSVKVRLHFSIRAFDKEILLQSLPLAFAMFLQSVVNMANGNVDKFVISVTLSPEDVSVYAVGMFIYTAFSSMTTIPISMYMPQVASDMKKGLREDQLLDTLVRPCRLIAIIGGCLLFGFASVGKQFISIIYGKDYLEAWSIAVVIMTPMYINMTNGILINVLDVLRKRHVRSLVLLISTALNIVLTIWWIRTWGIFGAAVATAISTILGQIIMMNMYYQRIIKINIINLFKKAYKGILPCLILSFIITLFASNGIHNSAISLIVGGVVFCFMFLIGMSMFGADAYEKGIMHYFFNKCSIRK